MNKHSVLSCCKHFCLYLALMLFRTLTLLPFSAVMLLATAVGKLSYVLSKRQRNIAEINIKLCFPTLSATEQQQLVKQTFINIAKGFFEMALCWWLSDNKLQQLTSIKGTELLNKYQQQNRGVILVGLHFTTIEMAGATIGRYKKIDITYKAQPGSVLQNFINKYRKRHYDQQIEKNAMRTMVKRLKQGNVIWYAPDQDFGRKGSVFVPFFNIPAATLPTLGKLQQITGAKVLMYTHYRDELSPPQQYFGEISDPFPDSFPDDEAQAASILNNAIEAFVREKPAQYNWCYQRFRTRPEKSDPRFYPRKKKKKRA